MAGKRYDQYNIAPSENQAMDYKFHPEATHGQNKDLTNLREGDKQRLAESQKGGQPQQASSLPYPPEHPAPSVFANEAAKEGAEEESEES